MGSTKGVFDVIRSRYPLLSEAKRRVAEYILANWEDAAFLSASKLGSRVGLSESVVIRLAGELGYDGYPELQAALQRELKQQLTMVDRLDRAARHASASGELAKDVWANDIRNIRATERDNPPETLDEAVDMILDARRVYVMGVRSTAAVAVLLSLNLNQVLGNVEVLSPGFGDLFDKLRGASRGDLLIVLSFPRYSTWSVDAAEYARKKGLRVIAVSDSRVSPVARSADLALVSRTEGVSFVRSHAATVALANALFAAVGLKAREQCREALGELEETLKRYGARAGDGVDRPRRR